jgi:transcriptional/translational regulatory protein YebC/TACO1
MGTQGSVEFMFILVISYSREGLDAEELELELIDFGAEEVLKMKTDFNLCSFSSLEPSKLENRNLEILSSDLNEFRKLLKNSTEEMADVEN